MSTWIMCTLLVFYVLIVGAAVIEKPRNWWLALYYLGALQITVAVLKMGMMKR